MKRYPRFFMAAGLLFLLCYLLCFPDLALPGAQNGLLLWYQNLLPVLLPFLILSSLLIQTDLLKSLMRYIHPLFHLIWRTSLYGSYAILGGFLFGFPMGAKITADLLKKQKIGCREAEYLMGFVNNLSPAFVITYVLYSSLKTPELLGPTLFILYGSPILCSFIYRPFYRSHRSARLHAGENFTSIGGEQQERRDILEPDDNHQNKTSDVQTPLELLDACIFDGIIHITKLGAYIMLFSILAGSIDLLPHMNPVLFCLLKGSLEITAGVAYLSQAILPFGVKYLCMMLLGSFGGFCAMWQTLSVFPMKGPILRHYLCSKAITIGLSFVLTLICLSFYF